MFRGLFSMKVTDWNWQYACPTSEGGGVWGFFAILAAV